MTIQIGDMLPGVELLKWDGSQVVRTTTGALTKTGKTMVIGVVGAFTPVCTESHLKDYLPIVPSLKDSSVINRFVCTAVVDPFVLEAWGKSLAVPKTVELWSDPEAEFAKAIGITADFSGIGLGLRSGRYSMVTKDGLVESLNIEEDPTLVSVSSAASMQSLLGV